MKNMILGLAMLLPLAAGAQSAAPPPQVDLMVRHARVFDGRSAQPHEHAAIVISGNRIVAVVDEQAIGAVLRVVALLESAGDPRGALRELEYFMKALQERVLLPLETVVEKERDVRRAFPWVVRSRPDRFRLAW